MFLPKTDCFFSPITVVPASHNQNKASPTTAPYATTTPELPAIASRARAPHARPEGRVCASLQAMRSTSITSSKHVFLPTSATRQPPPTAAQPLHHPTGAGGLGSGRPAQSSGRT